MNRAQREEALHDSKIYWRDCMGKYLSSLAVLLMGNLAMLLNLSMGITLHQPVLVLGAAMIASIVVLHLSDFEFKRDVYFGARRAYFEMMTPERSRFED